MAIVIRHLIDGVPVSDLYDEHQLLPTQFYQWQKQLFEGGAAAFERQSKPAGPSPAERRVQQLEAKLAVKNEVIAELMEENVSLKNSMGRSESQVGGARPRIISDNGPQFVARDFKEFIRISGMTLVRTSPYYPQSNGKVERWQGTLKRDCLRPNVPLSVEEARQFVSRFVQHYNHVRLHSAIGYVTPADRLAGRQAAIFAARDQTLAAARERRAARRKEQASPSEHAPHHACEKGTQRKASGGQGAAMSPLVARGSDRDAPHRPAEGETNSLTIIINPLTALTQNSISR